MQAPIRLTPVLSGLPRPPTASARTLELLSIGRTSLYAAVKRGDLKRVKLGKKTLFYAADIAWFLERLARLSEADARLVGHAPGAFRLTQR
jgi:hypothetical protein